MRLIDADTLEKDLKSVTLSNGTLINTNTMIDLINKYPTAYSVDKVVDELKQEIQNGTIKIEDGNSLLFKIVNQGGVSDDVCEWKLDGVYLISPHKQLVSCVTDENYRYYYCPICGKKIKEVE